MYAAIIKGNEGEVSKQLKASKQVWLNLHELLSGISIKEEVRKFAHPLASEILLKHGKECRTRFRPYTHYYDGRVNGWAQCALNSIEHSLETGMDLWSGYVCFPGQSNWHVWNVDGQGYVFDATYGARSIFCRYFGIQLDPYTAYKVSQEKEFFAEYAFLYWNSFEQLKGLLRKHIGVNTTEKVFKDVVEDAFRKIAII